MENKLRKFTDDDIKSVGLEILSVLHDYCVSHNIKYSLGFGTLLGAIRHNGFIPWDDDIDVVMPREDYERFINEFDVEGYYTTSCLKDKNYFLPFAKLCKAKTYKVEGINKHLKNDYGYNIDIFPMDYVESSEMFEKIKKKESNLILKQVVSVYCYSSQKGLKQSIRMLVSNLLWRNANRYARKLNNVFCTRECEKNFLCVNAIFDRRNKLLFAPDSFEKLIEHKFEDKDFLIFENYDEILKNCYGDYMQFPPKEKQVTHHSFDAYFEE